MRGRALLLLILAGSLLAAAGVRSMGTSDATPRARAVLHFQAAQRAMLEGQGGREFDHLLAAFAADPTYTPALAEIFIHPQSRYFVRDGHPRFARVLANVRDTALARCAHDVIMVTREVQPRAGNPAAGSSESNCLLLLRVAAWQPGNPNVAQASALLWRRYPESAALAFIASSYAGHELADWDAVAVLANEMLNSRVSLIRAFGHTLRVHRLRTVENDSAASRADGEAMALLGKEAPIVRVTYDIARGRAFDVALLDGMDSIYQTQFRIEDGRRSYGNGQLATSHEIWTGLADRYAGDDFLGSLALVYAGRTYLKAGELEKAESTLLEAGVLASRSAHQGAQIEVEHNLLHVYEALGRRADAVARGQRFVALVQGPLRRANRLTAYHDLGWYYWRLGEYEQARAMLGRMLTVIDTLGMYRHYAGEFYERTGDLQSAMRMYELADKKDHVDSRSTARRALLALQMGDSSAAIRLATLHDRALNPNYPEFAPLLPEIFMSLGNREAALEAATRAAVQVRSRRQGAAVARLALTRATLEMQMGHSARGRALADSAAHGAARVADFETETLARAVAAGTNGNAIADLARAATRTNDRHLAARLRTMAGDAHARAGDLARALAAYQAAADITDALAASLENDADRAGYRGTINDVSGKALAAILRLRPGDASAYVKWSLRRKANGVTAAHTTRPLQPARGEAVVDFVVLDTLVAALVATHEKLEIFILPVHARVLTGIVGDFRDALTPRIGQVVDAGRSSFDERAAHLLYTLLFEPLREAIEGKSRIVIVPDGVLHNLPFDALVAAPRTPRRERILLLQQYNIQYAPSLALTGAEHTIADGPVVAAIGPAPYADAEVAAIRAAAFRGLDPQRTESGVRQRAGHAGVLHFAAHAQPNDIQPLFAYLALTADDHEDGRLHAYEIERLSLNGALVILSGCDTGSGRIAGGEGVLSLSRAFLRAGASATVATLWPVGPGAPDLMAEFYRQLALGQPPSSALRQAKLAALRGRFSSPLYWAPFVLITA